MGLSGLGIFLFQLAASGQNQRVTDEQDVDHGKDIRLATLAGPPLVKDLRHPCCKEPRIPD